MQTLAEIRELLAAYGLAPRKSLGQNFLIDHNLITKLVDASGSSDGDVVLEVGPGTGTLTEALLDRGCRVVACELDDGLAMLLRDRHGSNERFTLVHADCLAGKRSLNPQIVDALAGRPFRLVANLPYGAATPLMLALLVDHPACHAMFVTIQREVADRLAARPSTKPYGSISVVAQLLADVRLIATLGPECFWPRPDVASAMIGISRRSQAGCADPRRLAEFCRRLFAARRKQLGSILGDEVLWPPGVTRTHRVEQLSPPQIASLCDSVGDA